MKHLFRNLTSLIILSIFISSSLLGANKKTSIDLIKERGKVRIGIFTDDAPFAYLDNNGKNIGFEIEIAKRLGKELIGDENKIEFISLEPANRVEYLETNKVDIVVAGFTITEERKKIVDFTNPYMKVAIGIVTKKNNPIKDIKDLKGKKVILTKGTTGEIYFTKYHPEINLLSFDRNSESVAAFKDARGDALSRDNTMLFSWVKDNPEYIVSLDSVGDIDYIAPAVKKGNTDLKDWINKTLEKLGKENFVHNAYNKTLKPVFGDTVNIETVVVEGGKI